jgi:SapC protein
MTDATTTPAASEVQLSGQLLFYKNPEPLNRQTHANLGLKAQDKPFGFVAQTHLVPLLIGEFAPASISYPIVFMGEPRRPAAVMGVRAGENLFVSPEKGMDAHAYVPFYVRRYPFALANDNTNKQAVVIIDRDSELLSETPDAPFFTDGEATPLVNEMIKFCEGFEQNRLATEAFCELIEQLELLDLQYTDYTPRNADGSPGEPQRIAEYFAISEQKLNALPADKFIELRDNGALRQIYAHINSLGGWEKLMAIAVDRASKQAEAERGKES